MKNRRIKISLLVIVSTTILYYVLSILLVRNGQFVNHYFPAQLSIENSVYNKNFIREVSPNKLVVVDTIVYEKIKDKFEIYLCEAYYYKSYGIFNVFNHRVDFNNSICLNVNFLGEERIFIKYNDGRLKRVGDSESFWNSFKLGSNVNVKIFNDSKKEIFVMDFLHLNK